MGQGDDEAQDRAIIEYLSQNALAIQHHPGAVQFQVSKKMLAELKAKFQSAKKKDEDSSSKVNQVNRSKQNLLEGGKEGTGGKSQSQLPPQIKNKKSEVNFVDSSFQQSS